MAWRRVCARQADTQATCTGSRHPNFKPEQYAIPLNLDQIPLSLQTSVACRGWAWISKSRSKLLERSSHRCFVFFKLYITAADISQQPAASAGL